MLGDICAEIKNFFTYEDDKHIDDWTIESGVLTPSFDFPTDYFRIVGSRLNDGVHQVSKLTENPLKDESFHGAIWVMSPPDDFLALASEIEAWQKKNGGVDSENMSPFQSESFGGYSYAKGSTYNTSSNNLAPTTTWQSQYAKRLNAYRRIRVL